MTGTDLVVRDPQAPPYPEFPHLHTKRRGGRPSLLDDPEMIDLFARAVADGWTNDALSKYFNIGERTARDHKKDPRVKAAAYKYVQERVLLITRKTDREIEARLASAHELDTETLLKIRKEFLGGAFRSQAEGGKADDRTVNEAMDQLEGDPDLAAKLLDLLGGRAVKSPVEEPAAADV